MPTKKLWAEIWDRPGDATYARKIADLPVIDGGCTVGHSGVFSGNLTLPSNYSRLDQILYTDANTSSNGIWSTVKFFSESAPTTPFYEWLPNLRLPPQTKADPGTQITGAGIESIIGFANVQPWDWDGSVSFVSTFPDWIYGGRNLVGNPGFETSTCRPEINQIILASTVSGGTFDLINATLDATTLNWNDTAFVMEQAIEQTVGLGGLGIDDVTVSGSGTEADPWIIEFVSPCEYPGGLTADFSNLTPAPSTSALDRTQIGALQPDPWTKSQVVSSGTPRIFGGYDSFRVTTAQAHSGTYSLLIDPANIGRRFAGAQQVLNVKPGGTYQASVWVYTASASQEYRLVIRGIDEDLLQTATGNATTQATLTANTWTQFTLTDVQVGDNTQVILRIANINVTGNPAIFYVDDGEFNEGMPPTTVGGMFGDLYDDATVDHAPGRRVWYNGTLFYLTLDFDDSLDSDGVAWADAALSLTFRPRMSYLQVLEQFVALGYEWRVVADVPTSGTYLLQIYNPLGLGGTIAAGIQGGSVDVRRNARYFLPGATNVMVQGQNHLSARATNAGLVTAFGSIEGAVMDLNITSLTDALLSATNAVNSNVRGAEGLVYTIYPGVQAEPMIIYRPGDTIRVEDPPVITGASRRVAQIDVALNGEYTVYFSAARLVGQTAVNEAVDFLLRKFAQAPEPDAPDAVTITGGGGMMTVAVAASNASSLSQSKADFLCDGVDDHAEIMEALQICHAASGGTVWLSEGTFHIATDQIIVGYSLAYDEPMTLRGMGMFSTYLSTGGFSPTAFAVYVDSNSEIRDLAITSTGGG